MRGEGERGRSSGERGDLEVENRKRHERVEGKVEQLVDLDDVFTRCVSLIEWPDKLGSEHFPTEYLLCLPAPTSQVKKNAVLPMPEKAE